MAVHERLLTVMVSPREDHVHSLASLRSVLADDALPFELIYVDILAPPMVAAATQQACAEIGGAFIRHDRWIAPAAARKAALERVKTPYVLFIDNDVFVEPGAFQRLVACAEETGAGLVGPVYLQGASDRAMSIHMAGGVLERDAAGSLMREYHHLSSAGLEELAGLTRRQVNYLEYHCMLARTDFVREAGVISDDVLLVHEHIDLALAAHERGRTVWMEPAARVNYAAADGRRLGDLAFYLKRWDEAACETSLAAFCDRWPVADRDAFLGDVRGFVKSRTAAATPFHPAGPGDDLAEIMGASELAQTRTDLRELALARGYVPDQVRAFESACDFATLLHNGVYRGDGRPFLNHVIGTASALVRYDLRAEVVIAGLLHAAYTHRPDWVGVDEVTRFLGSAGRVDAIVRAIPNAKAQLARGAPAEPLTLLESWALAIEAANDVDMVLAGEYRASARARDYTRVGHQLLDEVMALIGAPGLAATAALPAGEGAQGPVLGLVRPPGSFRLDAANRRVEPVARQRQ